MLITLAKNVWSGLVHITFPKICVICSHVLPDHQKSVCDYCLENQFEAYDDSQDYLILPRNVCGVFSLFQFDKNGDVQEVMHKLKYGYQIGIGHDLGSLLGKRLKDKYRNDSFEGWVIIAVPLHPTKKRKRGFNQAFEIAKGLKSTLKCQLLEDDLIQRIRKTKTQTFFGITKRGKNISGAFKVEKETKLEGKSFILVDDVFTTGATTFEICKELQKAEVNTVLIATVARAL